jgi:hypothetical protein
MACPGVYKPAANEAIGKCYTYDVVKSICIEIAHTIDVENAEEKWEYRGGCYENDSPTLYERATPGQSYEFNFVPIEVRADEDPYTVVSKTGSVNVSGIDLSFFGWLSWVAFSLAIIGTLVFVLSFVLLKKMGN